MFRLPTLVLRPCVPALSLHRFQGLDHAPCQQVQSWGLSSSVQFKVSRNKYEFKFYKTLGGVILFSFLLFSAFYPATSHNPPSPPSLISPRLLPQSSLASSPNPPRLIAKLFQGLYHAPCKDSVQPNSSYVHTPTFVLTLNFFARFWRPKPNRFGFSRQWLDEHLTGIL